MTRSYTPPQGGGRRWSAATIALVTGAGVVVIGGVAGAITLTGGGSRGSARPAGSLSAHVQAAPGPAPGAPSFTAVASVTPPVAVTNCTTPSTFTYDGTLSATAPGTVKYQWVYSTGQRGPVLTVDFTAAGHRPVTGQTVTARTAGGGWGEMKVISPVAQTSGKAAYKLLCGGSSADGVTVTAVVTPSARTTSCATAAPTFTAAGSIKAPKAETVTYYWALASGKDSAPVTLTFTGPGTKPATPLTITPPPASGTGAAVLVVTSPVTAASAPAAYTLTCTPPPAAGTPSPTSPGSNPTRPDGNPASPGGNPASPGGNPTSPGYSPTSTASSPASPVTPSTPPASTPVTQPTTAPPSPPPSQNPGGLAISDSLSETVMVGSYLDIGTGATGGTPPYTWTVSGLPSWAPYSAGGFNNISFSILGTANAAGTYPFTVTLSDTAHDSVTQHDTLIVLAPNAENWSIEPLNNTLGEVGVPFSSTFGLAGQTSGLTVVWSITAGSLPPGLSLNSATGAITGTPTQQGAPNFTIIATDVATGVSKLGGNFGITIEPAGS